jgi:hypothetical protein
MTHRARCAITALLASLASLPGCHSQAIDRFADSERAEIQGDVARAMVTPSCTDGSRFGPGCGLLANLMGSDRFREDFRREYCVGDDESACQALYERMFQANLRKRYYAANYDRVTLDCDARPRSCDAPSDYELRLLDSHNEEVRARGIDRELAVIDRQRESQANHKRRQWEVVGEVAYVLHDGPKCRSYPSVFGGVTNTICTEGGE